MAAESLRQGVVIPLLDLTSDHYSHLKDTLLVAPGFEQDPESNFRLLTKFSAISLQVVMRWELVDLEASGKRFSPDGATRPLEDLEATLHDEFEEAPWPAEIKTRPAYIRQSEREQARGTGALVIAACERTAAARPKILRTIAKFYGLPGVPGKSFDPEFTPGVQVAYAHRPEELAYLRHLEAAINDPEQAIVPVTVEPGEQLVLR